MNKSIKYYQLPLNEVEDFYTFFCQQIELNFPEYTIKTRSYFVKTDKSLDKIIRSIDLGGMTIFIAKYENKYAGFLMVSKPYGGVAFANWLSVSNEYQGKGIATKLLGKWSNQAKEQGAHKLMLWTTDNNVSFYQKRGFDHVGRMVEGYFGVTDNVMCRPLQDPTEENYLRSH